MSRALSYLALSTAWDASSQTLHVLFGKLISFICINELWQVSELLREKLKGSLSDCSQVFVPFLKALPFVLSLSFPTGVNRRSSTRSFIPGFRRGVAASVTFEHLSRPLILFYFMCHNIFICRCFIYKCKLALRWTGYSSRMCLSTSWPMAAGDRMHGLIFVKIIWMCVFLSINCNMNISGKKLHHGDQGRHLETWTTAEQCL